MMTDLSPFAQKIFDALESFGATSPEKTKSADQVMEKVKMGKGQINSILSELQKKGIIKRIAKSKRAGYYIIKGV
ncbi:MAG: transcriptional regulator [Candidatus Altiarchaeota archaeon]|nr:transcriptional regulator [Candidatus Altiarchaeota archaeon]